VAVLARNLGSGPYGLIGMTSVALALLICFRDFGTTSAIIQRPKISPALLSTVFWANLGLGLLLSLITALLSGPVALFFRTPQVAAILRAQSVTFLFQSLGTVHYAILIREMRFKVTALADIASAIVGYSIAITMALSGLGVWSLVASLLSAPVVLAAVYWASSGWRPSLIFSREELRGISGLSLNLFGSGLMDYFSSTADNILVGRFLGTSPLGYYQMAYFLMMYPIQGVSSTLSQILLPAFSKIQSDSCRMAEAYVRSCSLIALITFPVIAGMGVVSGPLISAVLGPKWLPVIPVFRVLALIGVFQSVEITVRHIYVAKGRTDWLFRVRAFTTCVLVLAFLVGVRSGIRGVAVAYATVYFSLILYPSLAFAFRLIDLSVAHFARQLWPQIMITGVMVASCAGWQWFLSRAAVTNSWIQLISSILVGVCTYGLLLWRLRPPAISYAEDALSQLAFGPARWAASVLRRAAL